jgi:hypothetical protein
MRPLAPRDLVATLNPPGEAKIKDEPRTVVWREVSPSGEPQVVKLYRHRGLLTWLRSKVFRFRVEREFSRLRHLERWGVPVTPPLQWGAGWSREEGFHEILLMKELPEVVSLDQHLTAAAPEGSPAQAMADDLPPMDLTPLFRMVRRMHESGLCNQTLFASNVLIRPATKPGEQHRFFLSDLPRSWLFPRSLVGTRRALWDLLDLEYTLVCCGLSPDGGALEAARGSYGVGGLPPAKGKWLERKRQVDPRSKKRRGRRDVVARIRWALAWLALWKGRARPSS